MLSFLLLKSNTQKKNTPFDVFFFLVSKYKVRSLYLAYILKMNIMTFTGNEGSIITLAEGSTMTAEFRATISIGDTIGMAVGKNLLAAIIDQKDCMGVRMYYALDDNGKNQLVLVGVDSNGNDMTNGVIVDRLLACPVVCSIKNELNSK